jgi:hypothetical protein
MTRDTIPGRKFTSGGAYKVGNFINTAGFYADIIAKNFCFSEKKSDSTPTRVNEEEPIEQIIIRPQICGTRYTEVYVTVTLAGKAKNWTNGDSLLFARTIFRN